MKAYAHKHRVREGTVRHRHAGPAHSHADPLKVGGSKWVFRACGEQYSDWPLYCRKADGHEGRHEGRLAGPDAEEVGASPRDVFAWGEGGSQ